VSTPAGAACPSESPHTCAGKRADEWRTVAPAV
jgi:hypothetical protein